jgi:hypothetical protein
MATWTAAVALDIDWLGHKWVGPAGTVHRVDDSLVDELEETLAPVIAGFQWLVRDEIAAMNGGA